MKKSLSLLLCLVLLLAVLPVQAASAKTFTLMIYMCGTDLESRSGAATSDLREMVSSGIAGNKNITVLIQTGGTKSWKVNGITNRQSERWKLTASGLSRLEKLGSLNMGNASTLSDFLTYGFANYPADRYGLIMWDHGSGASGGLCYDEITGDALYYPEIYQALTAASKTKNYKQFSFIGFDACLMGCYETAAHIAPFADYMIASEEVEPGSGWCYDQWMPLLAKNPGIDITELGKKIIDSFISAASSSFYGGEYASLSLCDLRNLDSLKSAVESLGESMATAVTGNEYSTFAKYRQNIRSFGELSSSTATDMIDMGVVASVFSAYNQKAAKAISAALSKIVVYSRYTRNLSNISGMSILMPFSTRKSFSTYLSNYDQYKLSPKYTSFINSMARRLTSGAATSYGALENVTASQQSTSNAQLDWFGQYANSESAYNSTASSYSSSSGGFSLTDVLNWIFGDSSSGGYNSSYDSTSSSLWGYMDTDQDMTFAGNTGYGSASSAQGTIPPASSALEDFLNAILTEGMQEPDRSSQITAVEGATISKSPDSTIHLVIDGNEVTLSNPFANVDTDHIYTVYLTKEQLNQLGKAEANLMMDLSEPEFDCFVDLGYIQNVIVDWNRGHIYGSFNGTWPTLAGQMVAIEDQIANSHYVRSTIPVLVNGEKQYLIVVFDEDNPSGHVIGYTPGYNEAGYAWRGTFELKAGDIVIPEYQLIYWNGDSGEQLSEPFYGNEITVGRDGTIPFAYEPIEEDANYAFCFCLTDIYGNSSFTNTIPIQR